MQSTTRSPQTYQTRTRSGLVWVAAGVVIMKVLAAGAVAAQEYPSQSGTLSVGEEPGSGEQAPDEPELVEPGQELRITGGGYVPGSEVTVTIESDPIVLIVTTADANGEIDVVVTLPEDMPFGDHSIKAAGDAATGGRLVLTRPAEVVASVPEALASVHEAGDGPRSRARTLALSAIAATSVGVLVVSFLGNRSRA